MLTLSPNNPFAVQVGLQDLDPATGTRVPVTAGTVTGFLSTSNAPEATAADPSLSVSATYIGTVANVGMWLVTIASAVLTTALLDPLFLETPPVLIVQKTNGVRAWAPVVYSRTRAAVVS